MRLLLLLLLTLPCHAKDYDGWFLGNLRPARVEIEGDSITVCDIENNFYYIADFNSADKSASGDQCNPGYINPLTAQPTDIEIDEEGDATIYEW